MSYSSYTVAKTVCYLSGDSLTDLQVHKLLYLMHMYHLGRVNRPLIAGEAFEAWKYGPVLPKIYSRTFTFNSNPIPHDIFYKNELIPKEDTEAYKSIRDVLSKLINVEPSHLFSLTHRSGGAWKKHYDAGVMNIQIPDKDIQEEYKVICKRGIADE